MALVNPRGKPVETTVLLPYGSEHLSPEELHEALNLLCEHLGIKIIRTNATKQGNTEIQLKQL